MAFQLVDDIDQAIDAALTVAPSLEVLANYTAFQQYRVGAREGRSRGDTY